MDPTQPPTQEPTQIPTPISIPQPKLNYLKTIIFAIILLLLLFLSAFFYIQKQISNPDIVPVIPTPSPTPKKVSSISIPTDETAGWKTYNNLSGYTFSYPSEFQLEKLNDKVIVRIDPPDIRNIVGICPRYISFSSADSESTTKISQDEYLCVYETKILGEKIFIESQYPKNKRDLIDQIFLTFKFVDDKNVCVPTYKIETNSTELTAKQNYSMRCTEQRSEKDCLSIDLYNQKADDFSIPDEIPDCIWKNPTNTI